MSSLQGLSHLISAPYRWGQSLLGYKSAEAQSKRQRSASISGRSIKSPFEDLLPQPATITKIIDIFYHQSLGSIRQNTWSTTLVNQNGTTKHDNGLAVYWDTRYWLTLTDRDIANLARTCKSYYNSYLAASKKDLREKIRLIFKRDSRAYPLALIHDFITPEAGLFNLMRKTASKEFCVSFFENNSIEDVEKLFQVIFNTECSASLKIHRREFFKLWIEWENEAIAAGKPSLLARAAEKGRIRFLQMLESLLSLLIKGNKHLLTRINFLNACPATDACVALLLKNGAFLNFATFSIMLKHDYRATIDCVLNCDMVHADSIILAMKNIYNKKSFKDPVEALLKDFESNVDNLWVANLLEHIDPIDDLALANVLYHKGVTEDNIEQLIFTQNFLGKPISEDVSHRLELIQMHIFLNGAHSKLLSDMDGTHRESLAIKLMLHQVLDSFGFKIPAETDSLYQGYGFFTFMSYLHYACLHLIQKKDFTHVVLLKEVLKELRFALEIELQWPISEIGAITSQIFLRLAKLPRDGEIIPGFSNRCLIIPGGHQEKGKTMGHALIYVIKKALDGTFSFQIVNTGQGIPPDSVLASRYRDLIYTNLTSKQLSRDFFHKLLNYYPLKKTHIVSPEAFYNVIHFHLNKGNNLKRGRPHHIQHLNSCESKRISCFLKERLTHKITKDAKLYFWVKSIYTDSLIADFKKKMVGMPRARKEQFFQIYDPAKLEEFIKQIIEAAEKILKKRQTKASLARTDEVRE